MVRHAVIAVSIALYLAVGPGANAARAEADLSALLVGEMRGLVFHDTPVEISRARFLRADGSEAALADYAGQYVLLNFWATWCAPCREEMPALQNLQRLLGGDDFSVVTLATGRNPPPAIQRFFDEEGITDLPQYRDINQQIAREMGIFGLPITVLIDPEGREIARLRGDAHWDSAEALAVINAVMEDDANQR